MRTTTAVLAAIAAVCSFVAPASADECPPPAFVTLYRDSGGPFTVDASSYDTSYVNTYAQYANISLDRNARRVALSGGPGGRFTAEVRLVERFDVSGVPPGTPVNALVTFSLDGFAESGCGGSGCGIFFDWWLATATDSVTASASITGPGIVHRTLPPLLTLPVTMVSGTPFEVSFRACFRTPGGSAARAEGVGIYAITGLPAGVRAVTCEGTNATPVRRATWGGVKATYR
jgi:hypothetical protein